MPLSRHIAIIATVALCVLPAWVKAGTPPLSPAQIDLFETPHLHNIRQPVTLDYSYIRTGPGAFTDSIAERIVKIHKDGSKEVAFKFLTGPHFVFYPGVDHFSGNPLIMVFLEHDVNELKDEVGIAAAYFRDHIRQAFVDQAHVAKTTFQFDGHAVPATRITLRPFEKDPRFMRLPEVRKKTYTFILADGVPGTLAEIRAVMPGDPAKGVPQLSERMTYQGEKQ
ncbi:MAG TPA: hypothetical protein VMU82_03845 [Acetobacteraceae bacterium]|nr:hypothetical protein [Acetobacteraceae bacterium]